MTFKVQRDRTRLFACQNPLNQGGGRKGLPKSFLNRFTQVQCWKSVLEILKGFILTQHSSLCARGYGFTTYLCRRCYVVNIVLISMLFTLTSSL